MKRPSNERRRFLGACLALGAASATTTAYPFEAEETLSHGGRLVHLRHEVAEIDDAGEYLRLRARLGARALNPWLRSWMQALDDELPFRFDVLIVVAQDAVGIKFDTMLDFYESFDPKPDTPVLSFVDWIRELHPQGRDDFLMALPLYERYRYSGAILPVIRPTPDPWLDAMLGSTRGMLFWRHQYVELVRFVGGINHGCAAKLIQDYVKRLPGAFSALEQIRYAATGQNMMQIIAERGSYFGPHSSPDYLAADWLRRHWRSAGIGAAPSGWELSIMSIDEIAQQV